MNVTRGLETHEMSFLIKTRDMNKDLSKSYDLSNTYRTPVLIVSVLVPLAQKKTFYVPQKNLKRECENPWGLGSFVHIGQIS